MFISKSEGDRAAVKALALDESLFTLFMNVKYESPLLTLFAEHSDYIVGAVRSQAVGPGL